MRRLMLLLLVGTLSLTTAAAWGYFSTGSLVGGNGAAASSSVNQGSTPAAVTAGRTVTVSWAASTLSGGQSVTGYEVKRYDRATLTVQPIGASCAGTITATSCAEGRVPAGQWVYSVTPLLGTSWRGPESVRSSTVTVASPTLTLSTTTVRPGTSSSGTAAGYLPAETLRYRLDTTTGTELTGSLAGSATPATIPAGGAGAVVVTVPLGTSDGAHTIHAVASPSGEAGSAGIVVDGTPPPPPVLTGTPTAVSGDAVSFSFTEAEVTATVECRLDSDPFAACTSPVEYASLSAGSHTFQARATDTVGNVSAATSYAWTVNLTIPTVSIVFPNVTGQYNDASFNAGCSTPTTGDVCGVAEDDVAVTAVAVSLRRLGTGLYWNGSAFAAATETFVTATGTTNWSYAILAAALPEGDYTLRGRAYDGANYGYDSRPFTIDRTPPPTPTLTTVPPATSASSATFAFTSTEPSAVFECRLDGGSWVSCTSPQAYTGLSHGSHTVNVRAVDGAGNASTATSTTWTVDATAPTGALTFPTATTYNLAGWVAGCGTPTTGDLCGTASDIGSGLASIDVSIRRLSTNSYWNGSAFAAAGETWLAATGTTSWSYAFAGSSFPADGGYAVRWRATDAVQNATTGSVGLTIDTTAPPTPQIVSAPGSPSGGTVQFDFTVAETGVATECRLDTGAWVTCAAPVSYPGLADGAHTFGVRATDAAGNVSATATHAWTVDTGIPSINFTFPSAGRVYNDATYAAGCATPSVGDVCGTASDPQGNLARVHVSIQRASTSLYWNGTGFTSATEVFLTAAGTSTWSYAMAAASFPAEGDYTFVARATDSGGLSATDSLTITIDRTPPPAPSITTGPSGTTTAGNDSFAFTAEPGAAFECRLDAGAWATCASPKAYGVPADGSHTFEVRATDAAGNTGAVASRTWATDATAPTVGTTFPTAGSTHNNTTWPTGCGGGAFCGTASDTGSAVGSVAVSIRRSSTGLYWNGTSFAAVAETWTAATGTTSWSLPFAATAFPADGSYVVSARATDAVGNVSAPIARTFSIDRTGPDAVSLSAINRGSIVRQIETGDQLTLTFSEPIAPGSLIAGWDGTGTQNITIRQANNTNDLLTFYNSANTTRLPLGSVQLKRTDYVTAAVVWGASGTRSTLTMSGSTLTLTFGTPNLPGSVTTAAAAANMVWLPRAGVTAGTGVTDLIGNLGSSTNRAETDNDDDF